MMEPNALLAEVSHAVDELEAIALERETAFEGISPESREKIVAYLMRVKQLDEAIAAQRTQPITRQLYTVK